MRLDAGLMEALASRASAAALDGRRMPTWNTRWAVGTRGEPAP